MKLKDGFLLREVAGQVVVLPVGGNLDLNMMITLNDTGAFLWQQLQNPADEAQLTAALMKEYDVDPERAARAVADFVKKLHENGFLE